MFVLHLITLHIGRKKHQTSLHIYEEDAHKIWGHVFISKCAVGTTTLLLAQGSIFMQNNAPLLLNVLQKSNYRQMRHIKHMDCSHALEEDAPKVWGHGSNSKWVKRALNRRTSWSGGDHKIGRNKNL